jgi:tRNA (guanine37-N1)-methyltransferase
MTHMLKTVLKDILSSEELSDLCSGFDIIGDIIIIKIPDSLISKKKVIANAILENVKPAKSIFVQISAVQGDFRLRKLEHVAGSMNTLTEYKEHGCRFKVDVEKTYFSPRLSSERLRIAKLITEDEVITNMFAGVGTYSILIAKINTKCKVYSIDLNPSADALCTINIQLNKVEDRVLPICGDAREIIDRRLHGVSNRVLMPLPEKAKEFIDSAVLALKDKKGIVHYFLHTRSTTRKLALEQGTIGTNNAFINYKHEILATRVVREVGPKLYQIVSDVAVAG